MRWEAGLRVLEASRGKDGWQKENTTVVAVRRGLASAVRQKADKALVSRHLCGEVCT